MTSSLHPVAVRAGVEDDATSMAAIYNHYIARTVSTFEEDLVSAAEIVRRMHGVQSASLPWLIAEEAGEVCGYAYAAKWRARSAYRFSVEITVYVAAANVGCGIASRLYAALFPLLEACGVHVVLAGIALPNEASVALHERFGMRKVAHFQEVGFKHGRWVDVGYWQRTL